MLAILLLVFLCPIASQAQGGLPFKVEGVSLYDLKQDAKLDIHFTLLTYDFPANESIIVIPELRHENGSSVLLPCMVLNGTKRQLTYEREQKWNRDPDRNREVKMAIEMDSDYGYKIPQTYSHTFQRPAWMQGKQTLILRSFSSICANCTEELGTINLGEVFFEREAAQSDKRLNFRVNFLYPKERAKKNVSKTGSAYLAFQVGKSNISEQYNNNALELKKIVSSIQRFRNTQGVRIQSVNLIGYSSPDGSYETNSRLAHERVNALRSYLNNKGLSMQMQTKSIAEDWLGLEQLVSSSSLPQKILALNIIRGNGTPDQKEEELRKKIDEGVYRVYFINDFYPRLRRVFFETFYSVEAYDMEQSSNLIDTNPELLSATECYRVALAHGYGTPAFREILKNTSEHLMNNPAEIEVHINKAATLLVENKLKEAETILLKYKDNPMAANNIGVMRVLKGDYEGAHTFFLRAQQQGVKEAQKNLQLLQTIK